MNFVLFLSQLSLIYSQLNPPYFVFVYRYGSPFKKYLCSIIGGFFNKNTQICEKTETEINKMKNIQDVLINKLSLSILRKYTGIKTF